ncbi:MAG: zinc ABC transporter solute-binding protein [Coleofasciculaceae cyanobacterium SM2_1_6]|nr:zinc ABC transporter solute-binding protein [Coleofasciculaceae cyanobacterium SM2_1_6]
MTKRIRKTSPLSAQARKLWHRGVMVIALIAPFLSTVTFAQAKPKVVVTSTVLCDLTKQIAEDTIDLKCLINPDTDPHVYQPTPGDRIAIEQANLIFYGGYNFEPSLIRVIQSTTTSSPKIAVNEVAVPTPQMFDDEGEKVPDPHVWHSAANGVKMAEVVRDNLKTLIPANSDRYTTKTQTVTRQLTQLHDWIKTQISTIPANQRKLVTTHDAFGYYSTAYGIPVVGALQGLTTEEAPTAQRVAQLVREIRSESVPIIFTELTVNPRLITAVAREANIKVSERELYADGLGEAGGEADTYQKMLIANTQTIVEGLGGRYTAPTLSVSADLLLDRVAVLAR